MSDTKSKSDKNSIRSQIAQLVDRMPEEMQVKLLNYLQARLPRRITGNMVLEKRSDFRRDCLVSLEYTIDGRSFDGFILDIGAFGVFIESDKQFSTDKRIQMRFTLPGMSSRLELDGKIVWSGFQGFGVKFNSLAPNQVKMIRSFAEQTASVYNIVS